MSATTLLLKPSIEHHVHHTIIQPPFLSDLDDSTVI